MQEKKIDEKEVLTGTVDSITDKPIDFSFTVKPNGLQKILAKVGLFNEKRVYSVHPLSLGTAMRISREILDIEFTLKDAEDPAMGYEAYDKHAESMACIVAMAVTNRKEEPSEKLISELLENLTAREMVKLFSAIVTQMSLQNFTLSIVFIRTLNLLKTSPIDQGGEIASGEQWEDL